MIWVVDTIKTSLLLNEPYYNLDVPIQIELTYQLEGKNVISGSISRKLYYNRPLLLKEAPGRLEHELDHLIDETVQKAITGHFIVKGFISDTMGDIDTI